MASSSYLSTCVSYSSCFYDLAKDPENSEPASFQPELGYSIIGDGGGKVNLEAGLSAIAEDVTENGATFGTFWEIQALFNLLVDGHVALPSVVDDFYEYSLQLVPERLIASSQSEVRNTTVYPGFSFDDNAHLQLTIIWESEDGAQTMSMVDTMNGKSVESFYLDIANSPVLRLPYQSVGARVNALLQEGGLFQGFIQSWVGRPSDLLPPSFTVTYADGTSELFYTGIQSFWFENAVGIDVDTVPPSIFLNKTFAESAIGQPGAMYETYQRAVGRIGKINNSTDDAPLPNNTANLLENNRPSYKAQQVASDQFVFDDIIIEDLDGDPLGAYKVENDYVVMKLSSFSIGTLDTFYLWSNVTASAKQAGIKNLMIDISGNEGGFVVSGYILILLMFPEVDLSWFMDAWDISYNEPMRVWLDDV
jgi:hypothetical protein